MEDEDGTPNKRGEAYCACRYLNCGRKFKSLKALEEHLMAHHNISWEAYTRYSPSRHHETIEETATDSLGKRKDAYCMCTYMECGRKFKMLKNLEEHVTLYHNISWQLYTQYYHRSVRKTPEEKSKSPKAEKKSPPFTAIKTSESPSPSSSAMRTASNGSASTPVSIGVGMASPVSPSPIVSFLPQSSTTYGQYPYLTAQVPILPAIIQYQPMLTAPVIGYASPSTLSLSQGYISQQTMPMSPLPESVSWYTNQQGTHTSFQQPQQQQSQQQQQQQQQQQPQQDDSGILNLSCPKIKKTRPSPPPAKTLDLSKHSRNHRVSNVASEPYNYSTTGNSLATSKYLNSYVKPPVEDLYNKGGLQKPSHLKGSKGDSFIGVPKSHQEDSKWSQKSIPGTHNGVIVIQPDEDFDDMKYKQSLHQRPAHSKGKVEETTHNRSHYESMYHRMDSAPTSSVHYQSGLPSTGLPLRDFSHMKPANTYRPGSPRLYHQEDTVEDLSRGSAQYIHDQQVRDLSSNHRGTSVTKATPSSHSSYGSSTGNIDQSSHQKIPTSIDQRAEEIYHKLTHGKVEPQQTSPSVKNVGPCLNQQIRSGLFHGDTDNATHGEGSNTLCKQISEVEKVAEKRIVKDRPLPLLCRQSTGSLPPARRMKRSSSLPNLSTFSDNGDDSFSEDRLVIDISDEETAKEPEKKLGACLSNPATCSDVNEKNKAMESGEFHLKRKSNPKSQRKGRCNLKQSKTKSQSRKLSSAVYVMQSIQRKYRHTLRKGPQKGVLRSKRKETEHASPFCKLILNLQSSRNKSCKSRLNSCDTCVADANRRKSISKCKQKRKMPLVQYPQSSKEGKDQDLKSHSLTKDISSTAETLAIQPPQDQSYADVDVVSQAEVTQHKPLSFIKKEQRLTILRPLKVLADLSYQSYKRKLEGLLDNPNISPKAELGRLNSSQTHCGSTSLQKSDPDLKEYTTRTNSPFVLTLEQKLIARSPRTYYQWRTLRFVYNKTADNDTDEQDSSLVLYCKACNVNFNRKAEYVKHRLSAHRLYRCKMCEERTGRVRRSHLYRYLATLTRHLMLDHGVVSAVDPYTWVTQDAYGGVDLQGVPFLENLDQLALVTGDKIYIPNAVYTYTLQPGTWTLAHVTSTDTHQMAAPAPGHCHSRRPGGAGEQSWRTSSLEEGDGDVVKVSSRYPPVLMTIVDAQYHTPAVGKVSQSAGRRASSADQAHLNKV